LAGTLIYFLRAQDLPTIKACVDQGRSDKAWRLFETLIDQTDVYAHPLRGYWYDIGNKDQLDQARALFL
jgi:pentatricopeptide repeat protein